MTVETAVRRSLCRVLMIMAICSAAATAAAQSSVGTGPLTATLPDVEPTAGVLSVWRIKLAPGVTVREIGWDDNVFDETDTESPKADYVASFTPDISAFTRLRFVRVAGYAGSDLTFYKTYTSERSVGRALRGRVDLLLSRVRPFVGGGQIRTRTRPNGEIDVRADRVEEEASTGLAFDLSSHSLFYAAAYKSSHAFEDALQQDVNLGESLSRDGYNYQAGLKTDLTPLLSVQLFGSYLEERFRVATIRNADGRAGTVIFRIAPEAVISGMITVTYRDTHFADPGLKPFRGFVGSGAITYPFLEFGRFTGTVQRGIEYSFDTVEAYYIENSATLSYTHRLFGKVDVQARAARSLFDYSARVTEPPHKDVLDTALGGLGYNLRNRTRVALNYEYARRRSPAFTARNYQRRRVFLSWLFAF